MHVPTLRKLPSTKQSKPNQTHHHQIVPPAPSNTPFIDPKNPSGPDFASFQCTHVLPLISKIAVTNFSRYSSGTPIPEKTWSTCDFAEEMERTSASGVPVWMVRWETEGGAGGIDDYAFAAKQEDGATEDGSDVTAHQVSKPPPVSNAQLQDLARDIPGSGRRRATGWWPQVPIKR